MRVLHIAAGNLYGGVERMLVTIATHRQLCPGMEPEFAVTFDGRFTRELAAADSVVHQLGAVRLRSPVSAMRTRRALAALLSDRRYDVVVLHSAWLHVLFAPVVRRSGIPLVFWLHGIVEGKHWLERLARRTKPDLVIANSQTTAATASRLFKEVPVTVLFCPADLRAFEGATNSRSAMRSALNTAEDDVVVVQVSRFERWKGHHIHLEALAMIGKSSPWTCWIVGGASRPNEKGYELQLHGAAPTLGIADKIRFTGERSDVADILKAADLFCQPNVAAEGFGLVFVEALSAGLPVISTNIGGATEIVTPECGVLVPPGDAPALASALRELINDEPARKRLGAAGPARARMLCDVSARLPELEAILRRVVHG